VHPYFKKFVIHNTSLKFFLIYLSHVPSKPSSYFVISHIASKFMDYAGDYAV